MSKQKNEETVARRRSSRRTSAVDDHPTAPDAVGARHHVRGRQHVEEFHSREVDDVHSLIEIARN